MSRQSSWPAIPAPPPLAGHGRRVLTAVHFGARAGLLARADTLALAVLILVGFGLRLGLLGRFPFHADEALYGYWARYTWPDDPLFLQVWPDKPPLFIWSLALAFRLFGASEAGAQMVNVLASTLTIPLVAAIARRWWGRPASLVAAMLLALNPFAISFAATAFTDPMLVLAGTFGLAAAARGWPLWAGIGLGAAIMTKQQGLLYAPLILAVLAFAPASAREAVSPSSRLAGLGRRLGLALVGTGLVVLPIVYWDSLRWDVAPSPWDLSVRHYGGLTLTHPADWLGRLRAWSELAWYLAAGRLPWAGWALLAAAGLLHLVQSGVNTTAEIPGALWARPLRWKQLANFYRDLPGRRRWPGTMEPGPFLLLVAWGAGFLALHVVASVQVWDRYLLPLAPILALAGARLAAALGEPWPANPGWRKSPGRNPLVETLSKFLPRLTRPGWTVGMLLLVGLLGIQPARVAATGGLPIGSDHGAMTGLHQALRWLQQENPDGYVLYHRVLGWHYRFYLYDPIRHGQVELRWYPSTTYLADNALKTPHRRKFLLVPAWAPQPDLAARLAMQGLQAQKRLQAGNFTLYELTQPPRPFCTWCLCRDPGAPARMPFAVWSGPQLSREQPSP
ncbi:glycosyltransferase family 39 protein [Litorilinea aerophila]|uniref:Phospholipid carrier-dependent glycosyltransferase n=1 Tax=Litorilinea aerophila TaxID=1204385 RepID=A0A540VHI3_9CHLR|nr:glycosyltransferase family 39 protein [Litorilinea aerophila]MCC9076278.1 glycosyltransferase family 39 protein [Litorilinea aerophila]